MKNKWILLITLSILFLYGVLNSTTVFAQNNSAAKKQIDLSTTYVVKSENIVKVPNFVVKTSQLSVNEAKAQVNKLASYGATYKANYTSLMKRLTNVQMKINTRVLAIALNKAPPKIKVTSVSLNKTSDSLTVGSTDALSATISPNTATNKAVIWTSSNSKIVTVNNVGKINAVSTGSAIIKVTTIDGNKTIPCTVTVTNPVIKVISVSLSKTSDSLTVGGTDTLSATVTPNTATNKSIIWTSSNDKIATVDNAGKVNAVSTGSAIIKATTIDGNMSVDCIVTIINPVVEATSVILNKTSVALGLDDIEPLIATVTPNTETNKYIIWTSSNSEIATVDITGKVTAVGIGSAMITATTMDGTGYATCDVIVTEWTPEPVPPASKSLIIAIDIGHNAKYDSGAVGIRSEDVCTKEVGTLVIQKLTDLGYTVIDCTPTNATSTTNALKQRVDIANAAHADYYLAIHFNIFNGQASGSEIYMGSNRIKTKAQQVLNNLVGLGYNSRGLKDNSRGLYVLKNTNMPAMLVECSFLDSVNDMARYDADAIAEALVNGLITGD